MSRRQFLGIISLIVAIAGLAVGVNTADAGPGGGTYYANSPSGGVTGTALRKFVDSLPGICEASGPNNLGQCIPLAQPDTTTYPGADYYEIGLSQYTEKMHSDLPKATKLRGYYQINTTSSHPSYTNHYLGPLIVATKDRPVRLKFVNNLPAGIAGNLFIPVDTSLMGAGTSPTSPPGTNCNLSPKPATCYTENRASLHLHGGNTPWISDGTPHQWITPAADTTALKTGPSQVNVPDMPDPGAGAETLFWSNQQSGRFMFYHDHAVGITRLNVYVGMAAGYLIRDPVEEDALQAAGVPGTLGTNQANWDLAHLIPLVIQDKTFVPQNIDVQDAKWDTTKWGQYGDLWFPNVYEANQDPNSPDGANPFGRWDYGPWFWPPVNVDAAHSEIPDPSTTPEAFMDTPIVNGTAYPYLVVQPRAYRFQILNAANDRVFNLSLFYADPADPTGKDVKMVAAGPNPNFPPDWPMDGRDGGVPDPSTVGPNMIQIGNESGILPNPAVIPNRPIGYDYNRRNIVVLNTLYRALMLAPAERADVIIDFSSCPPGSKLILYNDAPAPNPAFDPRYDYYTGDVDQTPGGGAPSTLVGYGPNTRTIMQIQVAGTPAAPLNLAQLNTALPAIFKASQHTPIIPETVFNTVYNNSIASDLYSKISDYSLTFTPIDSTITGYTIPATMQFRSKAIQELWDPWGRMNATLGVELPFTTNLNQTTIPMGYAEPATEIVSDGQVQIWKITHNGVDTHPVHFHLFDVQLINRVGWDGAIRPPDDNEYGWKETVRMNPLEDVIVALRPRAQSLPFSLPTSIRPLDPSLSTSASITTTDLTSTPPAATTVPNALTDFGYEYVWHCHILGHEENDFMRPIVFRVPQAPPVGPGSTLTAAGGPGTGYGTNQVYLSWTDNDNNLSSFRVERTPHGSANWTPLGTVSFIASVSPYYIDSTVAPNTQYDYRIFAMNNHGDSPASNTENVTSASWQKATSVTVTPNKPSPHPEGTDVTFSAAAAGPTASVVYHYRFRLASNGTTTVVQDYSILSTWTLPATAATGTYVLTVDAQAGTGGAPDVSTSLTYAVVVPPAPVITASPVTGIYTGPTVTVTLSSNIPANIYYTTDGTMPSTLSTKYTSPISFSVNKTINYFGVDVNGTSSVVSSGTWTIHSPDLVASMLINNGAISTNATTVTLKLAAADPAGVATMQFSNDGLTYSAEEPFATSKVWSLAAGADGPRTVYVKFRDNSLPAPGTLYSAITSTINLDTVKPVTVAGPIPGIYGSPPVFVTLTANEQSTIYYTTDGTAPGTGSNVYAAPIQLLTTTTLKYFAVDIAGNAEAVNTGTWTINPSDLTANVSINNAAAVTNTTSVILTLNATDPAGVATMQFSNDGVTYTPEEAYATTKAWTLSSGDGLKTVYVRFRDNSLPAPGTLYPAVTATITLDTSAPVTSSSPLAGTYSAAPIVVTLSANKPGTIYYTTDGSTPTTSSTVYTGPITLTDTTTVNYFSVDLVGNVETPVKSDTWTIDTTGIVSSMQINNGAAVTKTAAVTLSLFASDPTGIATMQFSNDGITYTAEEPYATSKEWLLSSGDGLKTVYVRFRDNDLPTGHQYSPVTTEITLDTTPPVTTAGPITGIYSGAPVNVSLTASEPSTIYYTTDGTTPSTSSSVYTGPLFLGATTTIKYFAVDSAGNVEASVKTGTWTIHAEDMVASMQINSGAEQTNSTSVNLTLSASDPTGVGTMQFSNDGINYTVEEPYATSKAWTLTTGDGPKTVYVRFRDQALPTGTQYAPITATITLDTIAPVTTASPVAGVYSAPPVSVILSANEPATEPVTIYYTTDGSTPTTSSSIYSGPITVLATTTIKYFTVDAAGNVEIVKTGTWAIHSSDMVASTIINNGGLRTSSRTAILTIAASDPNGVATMQFSNDGITYTAEEAYATSKVWTLTPGDGVKTVYVRFRDMTLPSGTLEPPITASITLDTTAPSTTPSPIAGTYTGLPLTVTLSTNETATIYYTLDGSTPTSASLVYTAPIAIPVAVPTVLKYFSIDTVGNGETIKTGVWEALPEGDLGNGGNVNDALRALLISTGVVSPSASEMQHGDVAPLVGGKPQPDGVIDIGDVVVILRKAVGLVTW
jgi:FtsP/CotA-like multicopper oxidase with cupredoxin domain